MQPKHSAARVLVYVESDEDIAFWRHVLHPFERLKNIAFDVQLASKTDLAKGKNAVLKHANNVGRNLILCVDSDLDYLLPHVSEKGRLVVESPFIFHTYTYSIENYFCYAPSLHPLCVQATLNDRKILDLEVWLHLFSHAIYELLLWTLIFQHLKQPDAFSLSEFSELIRMQDESDFELFGRKSMAMLSQNVERKLAQLHSDHPELIAQVSDLAARLELHGLMRESAYLFMPGHPLLEWVVLRFLEPICARLHREKLEEVKATLATPQMIAEHVQKQKKEHIPISKLIRTNKDFQACFLFQKLQSDLEKYVAGFS
jgi:hypothetical protein